MKFKEQRIVLPDHDCDLIVVFPSGKELLIQARPSNADTHYNGSLDIILPQNQSVTCWIDDDMQPAPAPASQHQHIRITKQIVTELP